MNEPELQQWQEKTWQRPLNQAEQARLTAWLREHPEHAATCAEEAALSQILDQLPPVPVASNFTSRVMQAIEREEITKDIPSPFQTAMRHWWGRLWPRLAVGAAMGLVVATFVWQQHRQEQSAMASTMHAFAPVAALTTGPGKVLSVDVFKDFETIQKLNPDKPMADVDLLAALNQ